MIALNDKKFLITHTFVEKLNIYTCYAYGFLDRSQIIYLNIFLRTNFIGLNCFSRVWLFD